MGKFDFYHVLEIIFTLTQEDFHVLDNSNVVFECSTRIYVCPVV